MPRPRFLFGFGPWTQGRDAERLAERRLRGSGYRTLARNLRVGRDEIDLVMRSPDGGTVVLVEVKSSRLGAITARGRLDRGKRARLARALRGLERMRVLGHGAVRVDAMIVDLSGVVPDFEHLQGETLPPAGGAPPWSKRDQPPCQ